MNVVGRNLIFCFSKPSKRGQQQIQCRLIMCPPPRKSLVKGERFIRSEGRPEWVEFLAPSTPLIYTLYCEKALGFGASAAAN